jgi:hypothetical protein
MKWKNSNINKYKIFYIVNKNTETELIFVNELNDNKKSEHGKEVTYNPNEICMFKQGEIVFNFLTADFTTEQTADKTFFNKFGNLKDKIKSFTNDIEMVNFQKKFSKCVDFTFYYEVARAGYESKFKEYLRHADYNKSLRYLRNDINVLSDTIVEKNDNKPYIEKEQTIHNLLQYTNDVYIANSIPALLYVSLKKYVEFENLPIRKCKNCGQYFIAQVRKDELYCTRIYKNTNKTCKQIGSALIYINRLGNDAALAMYRNMTKKKLMQVARNKENVKLAEKYANWKAEAKQEYTKYKEGKLTDEEFIQWLSLNDYQNQKIGR